MARSIEQLRARYNSASHGESLRGGGPGGGGMRRRATGKPKNLANTIKRLLSYVGKYKLRLFFVFLLILLHVV